MTLEEKINMIQIGGIWKANGKDRNGNDFYTGNFGENGILFLFKNLQKTSPDDGRPEYTLCLGERKPKK